jgi:hypothetical protein
MDLLKYFTYKHLPPQLADLSMQFHDMAHFLADELPDGSEKTAAIRKLLEAKDAAVRSQAVDGKDN